MIYNQWSAGRPADAERMEESSSWRYPIDLVAILDNAFKELPNILEEGRAIRDRIEHTNKERESTLNNNEKQTAVEEKLSTLLDKQQQVDAVAQLVADHYGHNSTGNSNFFMNLIGTLLLGEDRSFHLIQMTKAALKQCSTISGSLSSINKHKIKEYHFILAAVRYLAAHSPTMRSQTHTYQTAVQLSLGQNLFE